MNKLIIESMKCWLNEASIPKVLYHASSTNNLKSLAPSDRSWRDKYEGPMVFATPFKNVALPFMIPKGITFGLSQWKKGEVVVIIHPKHTDILLRYDKGGTLYTVSSKGFDCTKDLGMFELECVNPNEVKILKKKRYPNTLKALISNGIKVYFPTKVQWDEIQKAKDHGAKILKGMEPYTNDNAVEGSNIIDSSLKSYIEKKVIPIYKKFDLGHSINHVNEVISFSLTLQKLIKNTNVNMVYTIAAYHDIGLIKDRKTHHIESGKLVRKDKRLLKWFSDDEIKIISNACEDHRKSIKRPIRTIYGKILRDADMTDSVDIERMLVRAWLYRIGNSDYKNSSDIQLFEDIYSHLNEKYGKGGYAKFVLPETLKLLKKRIERTKKILNNKEAAYKIFLKLRKDGVLKR